MTKRGFLDIALFQIVWLASAIGASQGTQWLGLVTAILAVAVHLRAAPGLATLALIATTGVIGFLAESILVAAGWVRYAAPWPTEALAPAWIVGLWLAFATTLGVTRQALGSSLLFKATLLGLAFGPLSYFAGERLGALSFPSDRWQAIAATAILWGIAYPLLLALYHWLKHESASDKSVSVFPDNKHN